MSNITPSTVTPFLMFTGRAEEGSIMHARFGVSWQLSLRLGFDGAS